MNFINLTRWGSTLALFKELGMKEHQAKDAQPGDLIPYYLKGENCPQLYNDVQIVPGSKGPTAKTFKVTGLLDWYVVDFRVLSESYKALLGTRTSSPMS